MHYAVCSLQFAGSNPDRINTVDTLYFLKQRDIVYNTLIFLCRLFKEINFVCTTADAWSSSGRSFVALTVHWIDTVSRERKMAVLACNRIEGAQTYEKLAELMKGVHHKFGLRGKIVRTVTDNGANFCKSFREFGPKSGTAATGHWPPGEDMDELEEVVGPMPGLPMPVDPNEGGAGADGGQNLDDEVAEDDTQYVDVSEILSHGDQEDSLYLLPEHLRCAAHTFNLVGCKDTESLLEQDTRHQSAIVDKANELWKKQRASTSMMEVVVR